MEGPTVNHGKQAPEDVTARCICGWEMSGPEEAVIAATQDHGRRVHNMDAPREEVVARLERSGAEGG